MGAYQSLLWNRAASERVRLYGGDRVVAGDLVELRKEVCASILLNGVLCARIFVAAYITFIGHADG